MDNLPKSLFEKILGYLSLEDRLKARVVSRRWYTTINSYPVKSLCYSTRPSGFILGKDRLISGAFASNFIVSTRFESFFDSSTTLGKSILSNLKQLRLCKLRLLEEDRPAFERTLNSFGQLEEFGLFDCKDPTTGFTRGIELDLNLPALKAFELEDVERVGKLKLTAPGLLKIRLWRCGWSLRLNLVRGESVERVISDDFAYINVKQMKNLKYLCAEAFPAIDSAFLPDLKQLNEIHLVDPNTVQQLFRQKQQHGRADLKIYLLGCLLSGPHDPAIRALTTGPETENFACLVKNSSRLADEIPLYNCLSYTAIESVDQAQASNVVRKFSELNEIIVIEPVRDIQRFLGFLKSLDNTVALIFHGDQPQELFDRLPELCVQSLTFHPKSDSRAPNFEFLFRLPDLTCVQAYYQIDLDLVKRVFEELRFVTSFKFHCKYREVLVEVNHLKRFHVMAGYIGSPIGIGQSSPDIQGAIKFIRGCTED